MDRKIQLYRIYGAVIAGAIIAGLISFSPGSLFILILAVGAVFFIFRLPNKSERNFILFIFLAGLGSRIAFSLLAIFWSAVSGQMMDYAVYGGLDYSTPYIIGDSAYYTLRAIFTSMYWLGKPIAPLIWEKVIAPSYGLNGFIYILASYFSIFGYSPVSASFINCFLGSLIAIVVYSIVKNIFNESPARLAAVLTVFFPSMFLWSITNLKETTVILCGCLLLWSLVMFQKTKRARYLIITAFSIWAQSWIRYGYRDEFLFITIGVVLLYLFYLSVSNLSLRKRTIIFFMVFTVAGFGLFAKKDKVAQAMGTIVQKAYIHHRGTVNTGGICYKLLPDEYYTDFKHLNFGGFVKMFGKGWFHIIFEPLPWNIKSKGLLFGFIQMTLWYSLIPFAVLGMAISLRYRLRGSIILGIYFLLMTSALAVTGGNIGTSFRLRDVNTPIVLIFSSVGLLHTFKPVNLKLK